ncbi:MAG TPA: hypothetical protein VNI02_20530 [Blastocatellia bacterium]|jgi:hypothetical protein|nr:hypothetical protein [Blastocatellia bacterium]
MEMEKAYYVVTYKPAYLELLQERSGDGDEPPPQRVIVAITQGGFGQDVIDDARQAKERFLEYLFYSSDIDLPRSAEAFDLYFELEQADELIDLDEEV